MSPPIWSLFSAFVIGSLTLSSASPLLPRHNDLCYPHLDGKSVSIVHEPIEIAFEGGPDGATFGSDLDNIDVNLSKTDFVLELVNKHDNGYIFKYVSHSPVFLFPRLSDVVDPSMDRHGSLTRPAHHRDISLSTPKTCTTCKLLSSFSSGNFF
jgi:hypothetical protein